MQLKVGILRIIIFNSPPPRSRIGRRVMQNPRSSAMRRRHGPDQMEAKMYFGATCLASHARTPGPPTLLNLDSEPHRSTARWTPVCCLAARRRWRLLSTQIRAISGGAPDRATVLAYVLARRAEGIHRFQLKVSVEYAQWRTVSSFRYRCSGIEMTIQAATMGPAACYGNQYRVQAVRGRCRPSCARSARAALGRSI